ncbi:hypothetical protein ABZP36_028107 [Zizania latifolia]
MSCFTERRQAEANRIREKYPDRIPVIVEKAERSDIPDIDKKKSVLKTTLRIFTVTSCLGNSVETAFCAAESSFSNLCH